MVMMRMNQAIAAALRDEMDVDPTVVVFGEDVAGAGGPFKTSEGLLARFGPTRVRDTPISEMAFTGTAVGAAMLGLRPVVEIMFMEFLGVALDQLVTEGALMRYLSQGKFTVPMVLRASVGSGTGFGCQHSGTLERWVAGVPGLTTVTPSDANSAYWLTRWAIRHPDPVVVLEPRALYGQRGDVDLAGEAEFRIGRARALRTGSHATLLASGRMTGVAVAAADALLERHDVRVEVIDLLTLSPWDETGVLDSLERTRRLALVDEAPLGGGWSAEVTASLVQKAHATLTGPPLRITAPPVPVPFAGDLERAHTPGVDEVVERVHHLVAHDEVAEPWWSELIGAHS